MNNCLQELISEIIYMLAVIKTGGKQYIVEPGQKLKIERLTGKRGKYTHFLMFCC